MLNDNNVSNNCFLGKQLLSLESQLDHDLEKQVLTRGILLYHINRI